MKIQSEILNLFQEPAIIVDKDLKCVFANKSFLKSFHQDTKELIGDNIADLFKADSFEKSIQPEIKKCLKGDSGKYEGEVSFKDAGRKNIALSIVPSFSDDNKVEGLIIKVNSFSNEPSSENGWDKLLNASDDIFVVINDEHIIEEINDLGISLVGKPREDIIGKSCYAIFHGTDAPMADCPLCQSNKTGKTSSVEFYEKKFEKWFSIKSSPVFDDIEEGHKHIHILKDVTEIKSKEQHFNWMNNELAIAQEMAAEKDKRFKAFVEQSPTAVYVTNLKGDCIYANEKWLKIAGMELDEALNDGWINALHPNDAKNISEKWYKSVKTNGNWTYEYRFIDQEGRTTWVEASARAIRNGKDELIGYLGTNIDVTKRKITETALKQSRENIKVKQKIAECFVQAKDDEIYNSVLNFILDYFHCDFGYFGYINDKGNLVCPSMTFDIWNICKIEQKTVVFPKEKWGGIWGESLNKKQTIFKDAKLHVPKGHVPLNNALACVILNKGMLIGQIVLANKADNFQSKDIGLLEDLCDYISPLLAAILKEKEYKEILIKEKNREKERKEQIEKQNRKIQLSNSRLEGLLRLAQYQTNSIQEFLDYALNEAIELTHSKIGYIYFYNEETKKFILNSWSKDVMKECSVIDPQTIYELDKTGLWGEAVRQRKPIISNNYLAKSALKKGTPEGHVKLKKFLTIPVFFEDKIVAVCGVANKKEDYDKEDILQLTLLMDSVWRITDRIKIIEKLKKAQREAEENERNFSKIFNSSRDGYVICLGTGEFLSPNPAYVDMLGYSKEEIFDVSWKDITPEKWLQWEMETHGAMLVERGYSDLYEKEYIRKDGTIFPVQIQAFLLNRPQKLEEALMGVFVRDITKPKEAEKLIKEKTENLVKAKEEAEESERKFRSLFNTVDDAIFIFNKDTYEIIEANKATSRLYGYSHDELIGMSCLKFSAEVEKSVSASKKAINEGQVKVNVRHHKKKNGEDIFVELQAYNISVDKQDLTFSVCKDITELLKYEKAIIAAKEKAEASEKQFQRLFENMEQGFALHKMIYNEKGKPIDYRFVLINKAFERLTGINASDFVGKTVKEVLPKTEQVWIDNYGKVAKTGEALQFESLAQEFNRYYDVIAYSPQQDYFATVFTDVSKNKAYEIELEKHRNHLEHLVQERTDELETANEELKSTNEELFDQKEELRMALDKLNRTQAQLIQAEKMASLGVLIAGVAHELNNPINFISGSIIGLRESFPYFKELSQLYKKLIATGDHSMIDKIKEKEKVVSLGLMEDIMNSAINSIGTGVERSTKIIKSLLTFARTNSLAKTVYNIHSNIDSTLVILYNQYKKHIKITKKYGEIPFIKCYATEINQVWMNILINAIQAIKQDGTITITTSKTGNNRVCVSIKDTGSGMTKEVIGKIYDPFFTTKPVGQGTGLGLSIVYNYIKNNNGEITVESSPGKGTEFKIYLPIKDEE